MKYLENKRRVAIAVLIIILLFLWITGDGDSDSANSEIPTFTVEQGPLNISVLEAGTIKAREVEIIKCELEGNSTILWLIEEATRVKKGDKLMELDSSKLEDDKVQEEISVKNAETAVIVAKETFEVVKNKAQSDIEQANLTLKFAKMDLVKYEDGEFPNELTVAETRITLAKEELERAKEQLENSQKLAKEKYISSTELKTDELAFEKAKLELTLVENQFDLLKSYTYNRTIEELKSNVKQAVMALERTKRSASASIVQAKAELEAKQANAEQAQGVLDKINDQIFKTVIRAPMDGMVIYATSTKGSWRGNKEPLDEGQEVRERQELIHLPTADFVKVEARIHEANLDKVKVGFPVSIKVDAVPGAVFTGTVTKIAILPDQQSIWMNPDLKVYKTEINVKDEGEGSLTRKLRTGMGCQIEIVTAEFDDTIYVPVQAVITVGEQTTVYVIRRGKARPRKVEIGQDNNRMVQIISGLKAGEKVLLNPPLAEAEVKNHRKAKNRKGAPLQGNRIGKGKGKTGKVRAEKK
jgi:HlyD family secretion protein